MTSGQKWGGSILTTPEDAWGSGDEDKPLQGWGQTSAALM